MFIDLYSTFWHFSVEKRRIGMTGTPGFTLGPKVWLKNTIHVHEKGPGCHAREPSHHPELLVRLLQRGATVVVLSGGLNGLNHG